MCPLSESGNEDCPEISNKGIGPVSVLVFLLVACALGAYLTTEIVDPKIFSHVIMGRWIIFNQSLPQVNHWTTLGYGQEWFTSTWLFDCLAARVDMLGGEKALALMKMGLSIALVVVLFSVFALRARELFIGGALGTISACAILASSPAESELAGLCFFVVSIFLAARAAEAPTAKNLLSLFLLVVISVNIHPLAWASILCSIVLLWGVEEKARKKLMLVCGALILTPVLTPYFGRNLVFAVVDLLRFFNLELMLETHPATVYHYSFSFLLLLWFVMLFFLKERPQVLSRREVVLTVAFSIFGAASTRFIPYAVVVTAFYLSTIWQRAQGNLGALGEGVLRLQRHFGLYPAPGVSFLAAVIVIINVNPLLGSPLNPFIIPKYEMDYVAEKGVNSPILHDPKVGPYVLYRMSDERGVPKVLPAVDSRIVSVPAARFASSLRVSGLGLGWREFFDFISPNTVLCRKVDPLCELLGSTNEWKNLYHMNAGILRRGAGKKGVPLGWALLERESKKETLAGSSNSME